MDTREKHGLENPKEKSNFISLLCFGWLIPIFAKGARSDLQISDLYDPLKSDESERLADRLEREWNKELMKADAESKLEKNGLKRGTRSANLLWAISRAFWFPYMMHGLFLCVAITGLQIFQAVLQGWIIGYFNPGQNVITRNQVLLHAGFLIGVTLVVLFINHHSNLQFLRTGMSVRIACCSLIYRKILRLNKNSLSKTAAGRITNLISNDVSRFDLMLLYFHRIWILPVQIFVVGYVMWKSIGVAALIGIGAMMMQTLPLQGYLSGLAAKLRLKIAMKTDERVQVMSELISGMQVVKLYAWEKPFELMISKIRRLEMHLISITSYIKGFNISMMEISGKFTLYLTLMTFFLMGHQLSPEITFFVSSLLTILQYTCGTHVPLAIVSAGETAVSLKRLTEFLLLNEAKCSNELEHTVTNEVNANMVTSDRGIEHGVKIEMLGVAANWTHGQLPPTLCKLSIQVNSRSLCAVIGSVGCGKSSLLQLLLGELPVGAGTLSFFTGNNGDTRISSSDIRISYASQDPWLFSASVRHNILFGLPYHEDRYREVTRVCALHKDFEELPQGDLSFVGERGASLSGGQRARVNLARAVYRDADLYLLDDPLSAVDPRVGRHLFEECICGFLKDKTRVLVTHQLQYIRQADTVVVLNRGTVKFQGTYENVVNSKFHITDSTQSKDIENFHEPAKNFDKENVKGGVVTINDIHNDNLSQGTDDSECSKDVQDEEMETGKMSCKVYSSYFMAGGNLHSFALLVTVFIAGQIMDSGGDYWMACWANQESLKNTSQSNHSMNIRLAGPLDPEHHLEVAKSQQFCEQRQPLPSNPAMYVYTGCVISSVILIVLRSMLFMRMCVRSSRNLHDSMFTNLLRASMRFFDTNPSGRILNRFSKDVGSMDELLPRVMLEAIQIFSIMIGILTLVAIVNNWMIIPTVATAVVYYIIRIFYLRTGQNLKRLEGVAKSPVFSHVSSTLDGITTIRSRGAELERLLRREFDRHQDLHTSAWSLIIDTATAFGFFLDLLTWAFVVVVCFSCILMDDGQAQGPSVGMAISQSLILTTMVQWGMRQSTEVSAQMTSVERVLQYTNSPKEKSPTSDDPPPPTWPSKGTLLFKNVTMRYADNKPPVLKEVNVKIESGWKVGVVGRTGAGKSSLISALFRLTGDGLKGEIVLDGINTSSLGLHELRSRISIIPQAPILFSATLRYNLDPLNEYEDAQLWDALREVKLGDAVQSLDFFVAGSGENFSVGQRQLIYLARAILMNNRVLVLDEATANVDPKMDALIQRTIKRRFADCTVLTIAHRLNTIMDSDRIMVMAAGRIVEFGQPFLLLKNRHGHLSELLQQTGVAIAEKLSVIAENSYLLSSEFRKKMILDNAPIIIPSQSHNGEIKMI